MVVGRILHFVLKIPHRKEEIRFFQDVMKMKVLRHEEFTEGCEASCNGPYDNRWSKTMIGYGPEDSHFVLELTYNYNVHKYEKGNDFYGVTLKSNNMLSRLKEFDCSFKIENGFIVTQSPGGYKFYVKEENSSINDRFQSVILASSDLKKTIQFWSHLLGMTIFEQDDTKIVLGYSETEVKLEFRYISGTVNHAEAYGRIAFSVPLVELHKIEKDVKNNGYPILKPLISLETPGKATVTVVILADPDGHEICFVDDENFRKLSEFDSEGEILLNRYIAKDDQRLN